MPYNCKGSGVVVAAATTENEDGKNDDCHSHWRRRRTRGSLVLRVLPVVVRVA
jgi:hypothetical protein